jgi:hypothetical protein
MLIAHHEKKPVVVVRLTWKLQKYEKPFHVAPIPVNSQANWKSKYLVRTLERGQTKETHLNAVAAPRAVVMKDRREKAACVIVQGFLGRAIS